MKIVLWSLFLSLILGFLLAATLQADGERKLQYRWCWCVNLEGIYSCRGHIVSRTCWEVPLCRESLPMSEDETACWRRQKEMKQYELSNNPK